MNGTVARNTCHLCKLGGRNHNTPMAFARAVITCVTRMLCAFIHHFQRIYGERCLQRCFYFNVQPHYFHFAPFYLTVRGLKSIGRTGKVLSTNEKK